MPPKALSLRTQGRMLGSTTEGGILPSPSTKGGEVLLGEPGRVLLSHDEVEKLPTESVSFLTWTKCLYCNKEHYFVFLVWWSHTQSLPDGPCGCMYSYRTTFTHTLQRGVVTDSWIKGKQAANCFYYNITQKQNHQNKSGFLFLQRHAASLPNSIFCPELIQMIFNNTTWCGASVLYKTSTPLAIFSQLQEASCSEYFHHLKPCIPKSI